MTIDQLENAVERKTDRVDKLYMAGGLTDAEYNDAMSQIQQWYDFELRWLDRGERGVT